MLLHTVQQQQQQICLDYIELEDRGRGCPRHYIENLPSGINMFFDITQPRI